MIPFKLIYSNDYFLPIGAHVFPAEKYRRVHDQLIRDGVAEPSDFVTPQPAPDRDILLVHTPEYIKKLKTGTLSRREEQEMEVPYSPELVRAFLNISEDEWMRLHPDDVVDDDLLKTDQSEAPAALDKAA